jgi:Zn-dependent protease
VWVHLSCIPTFVLLTVALSTGLYGRHVPDAQPFLCVTLGVLGGLIFFGCILAHEVAHCLVAKAQQTPVYGIMIHALGGQAYVHAIPPRARAEFLIASAGPAANVALIAFCVFVLPPSNSVRHASGAQDVYTPYGAAVIWLMIVNMFTGVFNLIPAFPLDGGRILHSIIWGATGSWHIATTLVCGLARLFGLIIILAAVAGFFLLPGWRLFSLSFLPVGFFVNVWAQTTLRQAKALHTLLQESATNVPSPAADSTPNAA